jgi:PAS domain S-box-containing protein
VTARKEREQELQELKSQYQTLAENFPDGAVYLVDTDHTFVRAHGEELRRVGFSPDDFEGKQPHDLFPEEIADTLRHYTEDALDGTGNTFEQEYRGNHYRIRTTPVRTGGGEITHAMAVSQNVTDEVADRQELADKNERLEELASIVGHDLRNPLGVAEARLELAQDHCDSDHLRKASDAIGRSQALIDDLLTLAREGDEVDEAEPVDLAAVAKRSWGNVETAQATLDVGESGVIEADRSRLQQLFENLYRNSVEHGSASSRPEVDDALEHGGDDLTVSVEAMSNGFAVADTGPGIPESEREAVFEAGYSTSEEGTGLGLRIVEQTADAHGWALTVTESEQGGARFEFTSVERVDR